MQVAKLVPAIALLQRLRIRNLQVFQACQRFHHREMRSLELVQPAIADQQWDKLPAAFLDEVGAATAILNKDLAFLGVK